MADGGGDTAGDSAAAPDYASFVFAAAQAVAQVLLLSLGGVLLQRMGKLGAKERGALSGLAFTLLLPCLNFNGVLEAVSGQTGPATVAVLTLFSLLMHVYGAAIGAVAGRLVTVPGDVFGARHVAMATAFGNNNALPLVVFPAVVSQGVLGGGAGGGDFSADVKRGAGYMALYNVPSSILMWSFGLAVLRRAATRAAARERDAADVPAAAPPPTAAVLDWLPSRVRPAAARALAFASAILTPPVVGALSALAVGAIPPLRRVLLDRQPVVFTAPRLEAVVTTVAAAWLGGGNVTLAFNASAGGGAGGWVACSGGGGGCALATVDVSGGGAPLGAPFVVPGPAATVNHAPLGATVMTTLSVLAGSCTSILAVGIGANIAEAVVAWRRQHRRGRGRSISGGGDGGGGGSGVKRELPARLPVAESARSLVLPAADDARGVADAGAAPPAARAFAATDRRGSAAAVDAACAAFDGGDGALPAPHAAGGASAPSPAAGAGGDADMVGVVGAPSSTEERPGTSPWPSAAGAVHGDGAAAGDEKNAPAAAPPAAVNVRWPVLAAVVVGRLVCLPACGLVTVVALVRWGIVPRADPALVFVLLLESASPPAMNLQILADMAGRGGKEMAIMIACTYISAIVTLTAWIAVFLYVIHNGLQ